MRAVSLVASGIALLVVLVFLAKEWGRSAAIYAGILMAFSSFDLYYAQEARMYTLLAAAWIISYIGLVKALQGRPRWLIVWAIATVTLAWTHMYGFLVVGAYGIFITGYLILKRMLRFAMPLRDRALVLTSSVVVLATLPMARILLLHADTSTTAAWIPQAVDLRDLYLLWTAGLTASRHRFLDGAHLALAQTEALQAGYWFVAGTLISGAPALLGLAHAWRSGGLRRQEAVLALTLISVPVAVAFGYAVAKGSALWIQRPFLGTAYLIYLWAGIGFAVIRWRRTRWTLAVLAGVVALASLVPYFTTWQKSDARQAFSAMPTLDERNALLLELRYYGALARFYVGADSPLLAIESNKAGSLQVLRPVFEADQADHPFTKIAGRTYPVACGDLAKVTDLWIYGDSGRISQVLPQLQGCVFEKHIWTLEQGEWKRMDPLMQEAFDGSGRLKFEDIHPWTDERYQHMEPGDALALRLDRANVGQHRLTIRYYDAPHKILEIWADGQSIGQVGDGRMNGGWVDQTLELPSTSDDTMLILIRSAGGDSAGISSVSIDE
jgi:hypothetical protein